MSKIAINQIYYREDQLPHLDKDFIPYNNLENLKPHLCEWYIWDKEYENSKQQHEYWGHISWKFGEKTGLTGKQFKDWIEANTGYDLYFVNPCIVNEAVFTNSWIQGDNCHPGISDIANSFYNRIGYKDMNVKSYILDHNRTMYANYLVGNDNFWSKFLEFTRKLFTEAEKDAGFHQAVFGAGLAGYARNRDLPMFPFLIERLVPLFIELEKIPTLSYKYTTDTALAKYKPYFNDIMVLSALKEQVNRHNSDELFNIYKYYAYMLVKNNPGVLNLE